MLITRTKAKRGKRLKARCFTIKIKVESVDLPYLVSMEKL